MPADIFTIECSSLPDDVDVVAFRGREALSEPYAIEIGLVTSDASFVHDDAILAKATLRFALEDDATPYFYHGVLASLELLHEHAGRLLYRAVLVPKLWQLKLSRHSNVWTDESIDVVITQVLEWSGLTAQDFELRLDGTYEKREFIAQYKESNFAFISRWMERTGMFYFFEQGEDGEKLIITDGKSFDDPGAGPTVRYVPASEGDTMAVEAFTVFRSKTQALPANVELWDYDYLNPTLDVKGSHAVATRGAVGEISRFGDDYFRTPGEGNQLAKVRAEQYLAQQKTFFARGRVYHLHAGLPYTLEEHPRPDFSDKTYLVTSLEFQGNSGAAGELATTLLDVHVGDDIYVAEVTAIYGDVQYRAQERIPWPRIEGYESATVCGEADSEYAQIDDHGRYRVRVLFDESDLGDGKASAWVRMQQPYGGTNEGFHFPLVKGTEVLLWFMGGDCDRPVIAGVAPNVLTQSPVTKTNHTTNVIQTINLNLIEIEDLADNMYMFFRCPIENTWIHLGVTKDEWNLILNTEGHAHFNFVGLQLIDIQQTLTENVTLDVTFNYDLNWIVNLEESWNVTIANGEWNLDVQTGDVNWTLAANWYAEVTADVDFTISGNLLYVVTENHEMTIHGDQLITIMGDQSTTILGDQTTNIIGDRTEIVIGNELDLTVGDVTGLVVGDRNLTIVGKNNVQVLSDCSWFKMGAEAGINISAEAKLNIGAKAEIAIAAEFAAKLSAAIEIAVGVKLGISASVELGMKVTKIDALATWMETKATELTAEGTKLNAAGIFLVV